jgi:hypothetical protein
MIINNVSKIHQFAPLLSKQIIIVFDGEQIQNKTLNQKCKDYCHSSNYKIYIENTKRILREKFPESDIRFIKMPERSCLVNSLRAGIDASTTEFINIVQEDLIIQKKLPVKSMISAIRYNHNIDIIRYDRKSNQYHMDYNTTYCGTILKKILRQTVLINGIYLSKANQYCDQCHISTKEYYYKFIFPNVNNFDFMEHTLSCEVGNKIPDTIWHLGKYQDGFYVHHLDGRNYNSNTVK